MAVDIDSSLLNPRNCPRAPPLTAFVLFADCGAPFTTDLPELVAARVLAVPGGDAVTVVDFATTDFEGADFELDVFETDFFVVWLEGFFKGLLNLLIKDAFSIGLAINGKMKKKEKNKE